jgi:hypothetical protein
MKWAALLLLCSCAVISPKPGDGCNEGAALCRDKSSVLACRSGKYVATDCKGPKGCAPDAFQAVLCDQSQGATVATVCFPDNEGRRQCLPDGTGVLQCSAGTWAAVACPTGQACHTSPMGVFCH